MLVAALAFQIVAVTGVTQGVDTSTYATPALARLVTEAARINHRVPAGLGKYRAKLESEISLGNQNGAGSEMAASIEQVASELTWMRTGEFEQHVVGYRQQSLGLQLATLGFFRNAWAVPSLYGNRLALLFGRDTTARRRAGTNNDRRTTYAVHPLSDDRERFYRYTGGDTIEALKVGDRTIRIVRLDVVPRGVLPPRTVVFSGEVNLDVDRKHIVRMRGAFASTADAAPGGIAGKVLKATRLDGIAFVELVNSEVNGEFWLPSYQRFEAQAMAPIIGEAKAVFRIVSRFRDYEISPTAAGVLADADTLRAVRHALTIASRDSLSVFDQWRQELGSYTATSSANDFRDVAPGRWRGEGPPITLLQAERLTDIARFNRIEGLFTGLGITTHFRDLAPGLELHALAGYAWSERTGRARLGLELRRAQWQYALRGGRVLDNTNDFRNPFDSSGSVGALFGADNYDYVSRSFLLATVGRHYGSEARLRAEFGWIRDEPTINHITKGPFSRTPFLANRGIVPGSYARTTVTYDWHPDANAEFLRPGIGAQIKYSRGDGELRYQRLEARVNARVNSGAWTFAARLDAGELWGKDAPPQQLFEMGSENGLFGYDYKKFAGDEAVLVRGLAQYRLGILKAPIKLTERWWIPGIAPALAVSIQSGWTHSSDESTLLQLGSPPITTSSFFSPLSSPTRSVRTTVATGLRFFGGAAAVNLARSLDRGAKWKVQFQMGQAF